MLRFAPQTTWIRLVFGGLASLRILAPAGEPVRGGMNFVGKFVLHIGWIAVVLTNSNDRIPCRSRSRPTSFLIG